MMISFVLYFLLFPSVDYSVNSLRALNAISDTHHVVELYSQIGNEGKIALDPINIKDVHDELKQSTMYSEIFHQIYTATTEKNPLKKLFYGSDEYTNEYTLREFEINSDYAERIRIREHVFVCLLRRSISEALVPVYVSKEYNIFGKPYMAGQFLLGVHGFECHFMQLAEHLATVRLLQDNGVEAYYLQIRQHRKPAARSELNLICNLVSTNLRSNQYHGLCVQVFTSDYFVDKIEYPRLFASFDCYDRGISVRREESVRKAAGKSYHEFMICSDSTVRNIVNEISFYVSKAYTPNEVFVFSAGESEKDTEKVYLENLSTNIGVVVDTFGLYDVE